MLERLRIQNFKSWQDTGDMAFGSLTGFFGPNSSGKSSILQFLLMLKQTVESSDRAYCQTANQNPEVQCTLQRATYRLHIIHEN